MSSDSIWVQYQVSMPIRSRDMAKTVKSDNFAHARQDNDRISAKILKGTYTGQAIQFEPNIKPLGLSVLEISYE